MPTYYYTSSGPEYRFGRAWTPIVKKLIVVNVAVFLLQIVLAKNPLLALLPLQVPEVFIQMRAWQFFTYMFLHAGFWHLAFNMFALWMFGCEVEEAMGARRFLWYYLLTGIGAGAGVAAVGFLAGE
ncbi:rhomboid family intramembrane serine protease, partial [candidate division FCPU426 bacterium]|nr:rhomboid family intramembrane serine protease [candidate division FCPU426 bacterium]